MARVVIKAVVLEGRSKSEVARDYGVSRRWVRCWSRATWPRARHVTPVSVRAWRSAYQERGLADWGKVASGRGRKASISEETIAWIVELTTTSRPEGHTHWSCRTMAAKVRVSPPTVQRIWSELGLQPHRVDNFKVSKDPRFADKLIDVVGLYLNPPTEAVVLCMDEKSQIQALDRTQASLPMVKGRAPKFSEPAPPSTE